MDFLGMGWFEILVVLVVALLVLGPERLPEYARKAGRFIRQFRKITSGITKEVGKAINLDEDEELDSSLKNDLDEIKKSLEKDAEELKKTLDAESKSIKESVGSATVEAGESLKQEVQAIGRDLAAESQEVKKTVEAEARTAARNLGMDVPEEKKEAVEVPPAPPPADAADGRQA